MPAYDATRFNPPAPLARGTLRNPETGATWSDVEMLLDSGADVTLVPERARTVLALSLIQDKHYELAGLDGSTSLVSPVRLELLFAGRSFRGQFLLIDQP